MAQPTGSDELANEPAALPARVEDATAGLAATGEPISVDVRFSTREILCSAEALGANNIRLEPAPVPGFDRLSWDPGRVDGAENPFGAGDPSRTAAALVDASRNCYERGQPEDALSLAERAIEICPWLGAALFQSAKLQMALGRPEEGLSRLRASMDDDFHAVLRAAGDQDFQRYGARFDDWARRERREKLAELAALYGELSEDIGFWLACAERRVDLGLAAATIGRDDAGLVDALVALGALRAVRPLRGEPQLRGPADAVRTLTAIPPATACPPKLLARIAADSAEWRPNASYFALVRTLIARGEHQALRVLLVDRTDPMTAPLELFAARLAAFPTDSGGRTALLGALERRSEAARADLINEFEALVRADTYRPGAIETVRTALAAQYDKWRAAIEAGLKRHAAALTEPPFKGALRRAIAGWLAFFVPALLVDVFAPPSLGLIGWILAPIGIIVVVGYGVVRRLGPRRARLRSARAAEEKLRDRLNTGRR